MSDEDHDQLRRSRRLAGLSPSSPQDLLSEDEIHTNDNDNTQTTSTSNFSCDPHISYDIDEPPTVHFDETNTSVRYFTPPVPDINSATTGDSSFPPPVPDINSATMGDISHLFVDSNPIQSNQPSSAQPTHPPAVHDFYQDLIRQQAAKIAKMREMNNLLLKRITTQSTSATPEDHDLIDLNTNTTSIPMQAVTVLPPAPAATPKSIHVSKSTPAPSTIPVPQAVPVQPFTTAPSTVPPVSTATAPPAQQPSTTAPPPQPTSNQAPTTQAPPASAPSAPPQQNQPPQQQPPPVNQQNQPFPFTSAFSQPQQTNQPPPPPSNPNTMHQLSTLLASVLQQFQQPPKPLTLPAFNTYDSYILWREMCVLKANKDSTYTNLTIRLPNGRLNWNPHLTPDESSNLFLATMTSLGKEKSKHQDAIDSSTANGLALWRHLDTHYVACDTSIQHQMLLETKFTNIQRETNETFEAFATRYNKLIRLLHLHGVSTPTQPNVVAFKFISALNNQILRERVLINFDRNTEWHFSSPTRLAQVAQKFVDSVTSILGPSKFIQQNPSQQKKHNNPPPTQPSPNPPRQNQPNPPPTQDPSAERRCISPQEQAEIDTIVNTLRSAPSYKAGLQTLKQTDTYAFYSLPTKRACSQLNCYDTWKNIAHPPTSSPSPAPAPPPAPTPAPAPAPTIRRTNPPPADLNQQVETALDALLGSNGETLLARLQQMNLQSSPDPVNDNNVDDSNNNNNNSVDPYFNIIYSTIVERIKKIINRPLL